MLRAKFKLPFVMMLMLGLLGVTAEADQIPVAWETAGTFSGSTPGLTYTPGSGGVVYTSGGALSNMNLGTFGISNFSQNYSGTFSLEITFSRPDTTIGDGIYTATYLGVSTWIGDGVVLDFDNGWRTFAINGPDGIGSFDFRIVPTYEFFPSYPEIDVYLSCLGSDPQDMLKGQIRNATVNATAIPEPGSIPLLGIVLSGVGLFLRRRA